MKHLAAFLLVLVFCTAALAQDGGAGGAFNKDDSFDTKIAKMTEEIRLEPSNAQLYVRRANLHRFNNNGEAAASDVEKALGLSPNDLQIQFEAIRILYEMSERCPQALAIANTAVENNPKNDKAYEWRFRVKTCLQDWTGALEDISKALELNPTSTVHQNNQALMQQRLAQTDTALENFNRQIAALEEKRKTAKDGGDAKRLKIDLMMVYLSRSRLFAQAKNFDAMFADLNRAVEANPIQYAYQTRARAYKWREMYPEAVQDLTRAIELDEGDASLLLERGDIYVLMRKFPEAIKDFEQILKLNNGLEKLAERRLEDVKPEMRDNTVKSKP